MEQIPTNLKCIGNIMSNFSHKIKVNAEEALKGHKTYGEYIAQNFFGSVWYAENKFKCKVWQYHFHINTIEGNSLEEIMEKVSDLYGYA